MDAIDRIADLLASWVASLGAGVPQKCETLACIRGVHPTTAAMKDVIVLLLMKREQPRLQFFARCALPSDSEEGDDAQRLPEALPCVVSLRIVESRLSTPFRAVDIRSSEELAEELAASGMSWSIRPLVWRLPERRQLLDHIVTGLGDAFEPKTKQARRVVRPESGMDDVLLDDDPLASGRAAAAAAAPVSSAGASPRIPGGAAGAVMGQLIGSDWEESVDDDLFADLPPDVVDDVREEWFGPEPAAEGIFEDTEAGAHEDAPDMDDSSEADVAGGEEEGHGGEGVSPGALDSDVWSPQEAFYQTEVSPMGYVSCKVPPWSQKILLGRITSWPKEVKPEWRSVQCSCMMHPECRTPAFKRWEMSDDDFVRWLLTATPCQDLSRAERLALGKAHKKKVRGL